jgi:RimJ/RimL family protein N-acetyltransferase
MRNVFMENADVALRPPVATDSTLFQAWFNHPDTRRWLLTDPMPVTEETESAWLQRLEQPGWCILVIQRKPDYEPIGISGLHEISMIDGTARTVTVIGDTEQRRSGYGKSARRLILEYAFNELGLRKLSSVVLACNVGATRLVEGGGFYLEAILERAVFRAGLHHDTFVFSRFADGYRRSGKPSETWQCCCLRH